MLRDRGESSELAGAVPVACLASAARRLGGFCVNLLMAADRVTRAPVLRPGICLHIATSGAGLTNGEERRVRSHGAAAPPA